MRRYSNRSLLNPTPVAVALALARSSNCFSSLNHLVCASLHPFTEVCRLCQSILYVLTFQYSTSFIPSSLAHARSGSLRCSLPFSCWPPHLGMRGKRQNIFTTPPSPSLGIVGEEQGTRHDQARALAVHEPERKVKNTHKLTRGRKIRVRF